MAAHKAEVSELESENLGLKAALDGLQSQHASLINLQSVSLHPCAESFEYVLCMPPVQPLSCLCTAEASRVQH